MGEWSNLTQREKSNIIRFAIKNGVSDINTIRDTFNVYASGNGGENEYKEGGSIHIKHPGRLTALKERTGKTEAELWATGNAHTRKMITFARNARKWHKHEDGGNNNAEYSIIDYLRDLRNLLNSKEEDRLTSNISLSPDFYNKSVELASSPLYKPVLKRIAEKAMHQSSYPTRSIENFKKAIFEPDTYKYTGGVDYYSGGWDNRKRDLVSLFINGKPDRGSDLQSLEGEDSRGFDYSNFIATHYPNKTIKTYEGIFPLRGTIQVSPSGYELAKFLGSNLSNVGHYKNAGSALSASDNVASYRTHYNMWKGEPELIQTDLWDFGGNYNNTWNSKNSDFKRLQNEVVNTIGTPFILKSINPIRVSSTPDEEFENQMAREADAANVLKYDSNSDTYNTLLSLPELTVGRLRNSMLEEGKRTTTLSTGGPLYPFSFSKNPYWKTPVVRYDDGGFLRALKNVFRRASNEVQQVVNNISAKEHSYVGLPTTDNRPYNPDYMAYIERGLTSRGIAGNRLPALLGTIAEESGGNPFAISPSGTYQGLVQWGPDRYVIPDTTIDPYEAIDLQLDTLVSTLKNAKDRTSWTHGGAGSGYNSKMEPFNEFWSDTTSVPGVTKALNLGYIRPGGKYASVANRTRVAQHINDSILTK